MSFMKKSNSMFFMDLCKLVSLTLVFCMWLLLVLLILFIIIVELKIATSKTGCYIYDTRVRHNDMAYPSKEPDTQYTDLYDSSQVQEPYRYYDPRIFSDLVQDKMPSYRPNPILNNRWTDQSDYYNNLSKTRQYSKFIDFRSPNRNCWWTN